jgi:acetyltransferase-like isoleucine patch superfamily enzyme
MYSNTSLPKRIGRLLELMVWPLAMMSKDAHCLRNTKETQVPADIKRWFWQRVMGVNAGAYWPMHWSSVVTYAKRIRVGIETSPGWSPGCYIQGNNGIEIGDYTQIAQNVAILSGNHNPYNLSEAIPSPPVKIGKYCLLGFGSVILPSVVLGDYTIVGANAVVTKSYPKGFVVLAGNPATPLKNLDPALTQNYESPPSKRYHGYVKADEFSDFAKQYLSF